LSRIGLAKSGDGVSFTGGSLLGRLALPFLGGKGPKTLLIHLRFELPPFVSTFVDGSEHVVGKTAAKGLARI
jgi:hypothetical protein